MIKIKVGQHIIQHCLAVVARCNFGQRGHADGDQVQQLTGIIGQSVVQDLFGIGMVEPGAGYDGGFDFIYNNMRLDVKTMGRTTDVRPYYVNNLFACQINNGADGYIFASYHKITNELTVVGWTTKDRFLAVATLHRAGEMRRAGDGTLFPLKTDTFEIKNADLYQADTVDQLKAGIETLAKII